MPGIAAGSIFTFSLTLGDYIIPQVIGDSTLYIGQVVYRQQGVAGNVPVRGGVLAGADRRDRHLPVARQAAWGPSMRSEPRGRRAGLKTAAWGVIAFLHVPLALIILYAFSAEDKSYVFPPPALTTQWFGVAWERQDVWAAITLSASQVAAWSHRDRLVLGTLAAAALARASFFGRDAISLLLILPIALPGIITGIALRSAYRHAADPVLVLDHRDRPRHLLRGGGLQQRGGAPAAAEPEPDRGLDGPRRRRLPDRCATSCCRSSARRCWPARCWPSR